MFYSHEVLTSRKYGVATVWLVATLGSKANVKKVSRKAILDVDIAKTCETIVEPAAPMALRLQSSLLSGVTRVYSKQCGYVLADVESVRNDMRTLQKALRTSAITIEGHMVKRPEQLMLHDDPNFILDLNFADLNLLEEPEMQDSLDTAMLSSAREHSLSLDVPTLHTPTAPRSAHSVRMRDGRISSQPYYPINTGLEDDLGLDLQEETGYQLSNQPDEVFDLHDSQAVPRTSVPRHMSVQPIEELPAREVPVHHNILAIDDESLPTETTEEVAAPLRRKKVLNLDTGTSLRNHDLKKWQTNYLERMDQQRKQKEAGLLRTLAKENANFFFYGDGSYDPLAAFQNSAVLGKRVHEAEMPQRRVRSRPSSVQPSPDIDMPDFDIEVGRAEATPLPERHSTMLPWTGTSRSSRLPSMPPRASSRLGSPMVDILSDFEAYGPAGEVDTQTAGESQWMRSALEDESVNFFKFLSDAIEEGGRGSVGFAQLLPPDKHTKIVAAQGFMHVLTLSTRGLLSALQVEPWDDIELTIL